MKGYHGFAVISSLSHCAIVHNRLQAFAKDMSARELRYLRDILGWQVETHFRTIYELDRLL